MLTSSAQPKRRGIHRKPDVIYPFNEADDRMADIFRNHDFAHIDHRERHQLVHFYELLMRNQESQNFTRLLKLRDVAIKHFIDCLIILKLTPLRFPLLDVGTGAGFPGIPLKIMLPEESIVLAEGVQKRVEFLKKVRSELGLKNLEIIGRNVDENFLYPVQGVITRAVEDSAQTLRNVLPCLQTGGQVFLMKGPNVGDEGRKAEREMNEYYRLDQDIAYTLPKTPHQRRLLVFTKIKAAPILD